MQVRRNIYNNVDSFERMVQIASRNNRNKNRFILAQMRKKATNDKLNCMLNLVIIFSFFHTWPLICSYELLRWLRSFESWFVFILFYIRWDSTKVVPVGGASALTYICISTSFTLLKQFFLNVLIFIFLSLAIHCPFVFGRALFSVRNAKCLLAIYFIFFLGLWYQSPTISNISM